MIEYHTLLGILTLLLAAGGYAWYFRSIFLGETKPHVFTWLTYAIIDSTVSFAQFTHGGGPGSWVLAFAAVMNIVLVVLSLTHGEKRIHKIDWLCLVGALSGIVLWWITDDALSAVMLATVVNVIGLVPTFRKSFARPYEESISIWLIGVVKFSLSIVALESLTITTALFPAGIVIANSLLIFMILLRRRKLGKVSA